jgi:uncharacterized HAD superfamily protein
MSKERLFSSEVFFEKYKIGFDHDGVIANTSTPVVDEYNKIFRTNHTVDEIREYRTLARWAERDLGVSKKAALEIDNYLWFKRPDILLRAEPMPGAVEITKQLAAKEIFFPIITSRLSSYRRSTFKWYEEKMPWINRNQIFIRENDEIEGEVFKARMIEERGVSVFFEDAPHHAKIIIRDTNAMVILLNNDPVLDDLAGDRMIRIATNNNRLPTLREAQATLFRG